MLLFLKGEFVSFFDLSFLLSNISFSSAQWGFHPGGWGKPPLDEYNRPLYGDVFGVLPKAGDSGVSVFFLDATFDLVLFIFVDRPANL